MLRESMAVYLLSAVLYSHVGGLGCVGVSMQARAIGVALNCGCADPQHTARRLWRNLLWYFAPGVCEETCRNGFCLVGALHQLLLRVSLDQAPLWVR